MVMVNHSLTISNSQVPTEVMVNVSLTINAKQTTGMMVNSPLTINMLRTMDCPHCRRKLANSMGQGHQTSHINHSNMGLIHPLVNYRLRGPTSPQGHTNYLHNLHNNWSNNKGLAPQMGPTTHWGHIYHLHHYQSSNKSRAVQASNYPQQLLTMATPMLNKNKL